MTWTDVPPNDAVSSVSVPEPPTPCLDFREECFEWEKTAEELGNIVHVSPTDPLADYRYIQEAIDAYHSVCTTSNPYIIQLDGQLQWVRDSIQEEKYRKNAIRLFNHQGGFVIRGKGFSTRILWFNGVQGHSDEPTPFRTDIVVVSNAKVFIRDCSIGTFSACIPPTTSATYPDSIWVEPYIQREGATTLAYEYEYEFYKQYDTDPYPGYDGNDVSTGDIIAGSHGMSSTSAFGGETGFTRDTGFFFYDCNLTNMYDLIKFADNTNGHKNIAVVEKCTVVDNPLRIDDFEANDPPMAVAHDSYGIGCPNGYIYVKDVTHSPGLVNSSIWMSTGSSYPDPEEWYLEVLKPGPQQWYFENVHWNYISPISGRGFLHIGWMSYHQDSWIVFNGCSWLIESSNQRVWLDGDTPGPNTLGIGPFLSMNYERAEERGSDWFDYYSTEDQGMSVYLVNCLLRVDLYRIQEYLEKAADGASISDDLWYDFSFCPTGAPTGRVDPTKWPLYVINFKREILGRKEDKDRWRKVKATFDDYVLKEY